MFSIAIVVAAIAPAAFGASPSHKAVSTGGPLTGNALLDELERRAVDFFWNESNPETGFTKDRATNFAENDQHTVASIASIGFALSAYPIGVERKWLDRQKALDRTRLTLAHILSDAESSHGWYFHFIDWKTGRRQWNCELSTIDTSIMLAGVWVAQQYWKDPQVDRDAQAITKGMDWQWFMKEPGGKSEGIFLNMGWKPESGFLDGNWAGYDELLMLYIQGYGASNITTDGWDKIGRKPISYDGHTCLSGGPLFMHQMANGFYDMSERRDRQGYSYWVSTKEATLSNRAYCIDNPKHFDAFGPNFWGLSACDTPSGYNAIGAPPDTNDDGTITPTSAIASLEYTPKESMAFAESMFANHPGAFGRYGFSNGVNPSKSWVGPDVIGIDLGMMLVGIENYRTKLIHRLSMSHPLVQRGFERAGLIVVPGSNQGPLKVDR